MENQWVHQKIWINQTVSKLEKHPEIKWVDHRSNYIKVIFKNTNVTEYWILSPTFNRKQNRCYIYPKEIDCSNFDQQAIPILNQFEINPLYPETANLLKTHFIVRACDLEEANWVSIRLLVHRLAKQLYDEGLIKFEYTSQILSQEKESFSSISDPYIDRFQKSLIKFKKFPYRPNILRSIFQFAPIELSSAKSNWKLGKLATAINDLIISGSSVTRELITYRLLDLKIPDYAYLVAIFRQWFNSDKIILDLEPCASNIIASYATGKNYFSTKNLDEYQDLAKFLNYPISTKLDQTPDLICFNLHRPISTQEAWEKINKFSDHKIALLVKSESFHDFRGQKNVKLLRILSHNPHSPLDNYLIIHQK